MSKRIRLSLLACGLAIGSLASCSRANYAFQPVAPSYLGTVPAATPVAPATAATTPSDAPAATRSLRLATTAGAMRQASRARHAAKAAAASVLVANAAQARPVEAKAVKKSVLRRLLLAPKEAQEGGKSQLTALLLCIFLGGLGIHQFYLGYTGRGILRLLLFIFGFLIIPALVNLVLYIIDIIKIANGDLKPRDGDYAKKL